MYHYRGSSGDPYTEATIHADEECIDGPARPIADSTVESVEDELDFCGECVGNASDSGDGGEPDNADTCQEVMDNGEICGRDRPCRYHD